MALAVPDGCAGYRGHRTREVRREMRGSDRDEPGVGPEGAGQTGIVLIAAQFDSPVLAAIARDRLRRHTVRAAGKLRLSSREPPATGAVVSGPIDGASMPVVRAIVDELGGVIVIEVGANDRRNRGAMR
jgi:hypothetical protein